MLGQHRQHFDYIVVGGETAGAVAAARLAQQPATTVCLIEAGQTDEGRPDILALKNWPQLPGTELDYNYVTEPAVGRSVADRINGQPTPEPDALSPNRSAGIHPGQVEDFMRRF